MLFTAGLFKRFKCFWTSSFCLVALSLAAQHTEIKPHKQKITAKPLLVLPLLLNWERPIFFSTPPLKLVAFSHYTKSSKPVQFEAKALLLLVVTQPLHLKLIRRSSLPLCLSHQTSKAHNFGCGTGSCSTKKKKPNKNKTPLVLTAQCPPLSL